MFLDRRLAVAPMMDYTDRIFRSVLRLLTKRTLLYTEMITTWALQHGNQTKLLRFDAREHPIALQLGGNDPRALAECAKLGAVYGYDEINFNVGCPSPRVSANRFGACLMAEPSLVAECIQAMQSSVAIPVTIKHRIGIDRMETYADLQRFVETLIIAGCKIFIVHARHAKLNGISPKNNRQIPPLQYTVVHQLKRDFSQIQIILNGGIVNLEQASQQLNMVDGVMIGRAAYDNPWLLTAADHCIFDEEPCALSRHVVIEKFLPQITEYLNEGIPLSQITRHLLNLFHGEPKARLWRRMLSENSRLSTAGLNVLEQALDAVCE